MKSDVVSQLFSFIRRFVDIQVNVITPFGNIDLSRKPEDSFVTNFQWIKYSSEVKSLLLQYSLL